MISLSLWARKNALTIVVARTPVNAIKLAKTIT
jgi:hypothetical protein